ncbi:MAG: KH domain-containing protein [Candidatus Dormibacteraeota bacterium]|nr:KH domain-containing protein [Candidatus Dormibacteraeota bacterium]
MRSHESRGEFRGPRDRFRGGGDRDRGGFRGGDRERGGFRGGDRDRGGFRGRPSGPSGPSIDYKGLVEFIAKAVAEKPDEVRVTAFDRGRGAVAIKVKMADSDVGRLIGKSGRNIEALRALVRVASLRERRKVFVDLATPRP